MKIGETEVKQLIISTSEDYSIMGDLGEVIGEVRVNYEEGELIYIKPVLYSKFHQKLFDTGAMELHPLSVVFDDKDINKEQGFLDRAYLKHVGIISTKKKNLVEVFDEKIGSMESPKFTQEEHDSIRESRRDYHKSNKRIEVPEPIFNRNGLRPSPGDIAWDKHIWQSPHMNESPDTIPNTNERMDFIDDVAKSLFTSRKHFGITPLGCYKKAEMLWKAREEFLK